MPSDAARKFRSRAPGVPCRSDDRVALRSPVRYFVQDDSMTMFIGPDETGILLGWASSSGMASWRSSMRCDRLDPST